MSAYVILDMDIKDYAEFQRFMASIKSAMDKVGARYLARGVEHQVHEGDWWPRRIVLLEFPSMATWEAFYVSSACRELNRIKNSCNSARLVSVVGL